MFQGHHPRLLPWVLTVVLMAGALMAQAQSLAPTPPTDPALVGPWREAWYDWGRDIRAWCATHELARVQGCLTREMGRVGVTPAWFAELYRTAPKPSLPPVPLSTTSTTCTTSSWGAGDFVQSTTTCSSYEGR